MPRRTPASSRIVYKDGLAVYTGPLPEKVRGISTGELMRPNETLLEVEDYASPEALRAAIQRVLADGERLRLVDLLRLGELLARLAERPPGIRLEPEEGPVLDLPGTPTLGPAAIIRVGRLCLALLEIPEDAPLEGRSAFSRAWVREVLRSVLAHECLPVSARARLDALAAAYGVPGLDDSA